MRRSRTTFAVVVAAIAAAVAVGGAAARPTVATAPAASACRAGYYANVSGRCVRRPAHALAAPAGASARCRDGTFSFSQHASGTCSHHGGVAVWLHHP